ncbi:hypothetical protein [Chitinimonas lacunae]|uniref:Uncharacterized protein n=1 Tax=Chitinimonas lacunae TaxID=1963018 RepID=A0ABV8MX87_9NEIS
MPSIKNPHNETDCVELDVELLEQVGGGGPLFMENTASKFIEEKSDAPPIPTQGF